MTNTVVVHVVKVSNFKGKNMIAIKVNLIVSMPNHDVYVLTRYYDYTIDNLIRKSRKVTSKVQSCGDTRKME